MSTALARAPAGRVCNDGSVEIAVPLPETLVDALVARVAEQVFARLERERGGYLDVDGAAEYLASSPGAIRKLVERGQIPVHRAPNGRLLFDREELSAWVRSAAP